MDLKSFRTLGRSGLVVSPLALGTMTFGNPKWGSPDDVSRAIFDAYVDAGGNFVDTADVYGGGRSEELLGSFIQSGRLRDQLVLASKYTFSAQPGNPNAAGNGRKNLHRALESSLRRLQTDYLDLFYLHAWDLVTPVEEVLESLIEVQRAGKIRYFGLSDVPAWYATRMVTLAQAHQLPAPIVLQLEYSLIERSIEREHLPAAQHLGLGVVPWGPIGAGFLSGKYTRDGDTVAGDGRFGAQKPGRKFTDRDWQTLEALRTVAAELNRPLAQVALAWVAAQPGITAPILGASKLDQLHGAISSLELALTPGQLQRLDQPSALSPAHPYQMMLPATNKMLFSGTTVQGWK